MNLTEIVLSLVVALISIIGGLSAYIFNTTITAIKEEGKSNIEKANKDIAVLWAKFDELKETVGEHQLKAENRFGRIDTMLGIKDQQYSEIMDKLDTLTDMLKDVIAGRFPKP